MFQKTFVCGLALALVGACSDDGAPGQGQNSSTAAETGGTTNATSTTDDGVGTGGGETGTATEGPPLPTTGTAEGTGPETGTGTADTGTGTTGTETGTESGSTSTGEICEPITEDASDVGTQCMNDLDCEPGYTCQEFIGVALEMTCQIICEETCECPMGLTCTFTEDKSGSWFQCNP